MSVMVGPSAPIGLEVSGWIVVQSSANLDGLAVAETRKRSLYVC